MSYDRILGPTPLGSCIHAKFNFECNTCYRGGWIAEPTKANTVNQIVGSPEERKENELNNLRIQNEVILKYNDSLEEDLKKAHEKIRALKLVLEMYQEKR